ncbi:MAG: hypothetical protein MRY74_15610 [Neomegalonema sp.]|nr:hypothetical protein [Neomegalonema sp.]
MEKFLEGIDGNTILMLLIYSGLASWLVARLTRSATDATAASRQALAESLALLAQLSRAQELVKTEERRRELEVMRARVEEEVAGRVDELNGVAELLNEHPSSQFVLLPRPRTLWSVFVSLVSILSFFWSGFWLVRLGRAVFATREGVDPTTTAGQELLLALGGGAIALISLGFVTRFLAFRAYDAYARRLRARGASAAKAASQE